MKNKVHAQILRFLSKKKIVKLETTILRNIPSVKITKIQNVLLIKNCHIKGPPKEECQNVSVCFKDIYLSTTQSYKRFVLWHTYTKEAQLAQKNNERSQTQNEIKFENPHESKKLYNS